MSTTMTVEIRGLRLRAFHGLYPQERTVGNVFEVSASLTYPVAGGCEDMEITDTISYADMAEIIRYEMSRPRDLLESVALAIRSRFADRWPRAVSGSVTVAKLTPPLGLQMQGASVTLRW